MVEFLRNFRKIKIIVVIDVGRGRREINLVYWDILSRKIDYGSLMKFNIYLGNYEWDWIL